MRTLSELNLQKYGLFIFDWDGTLIDSQNSYTEWDQLFVKTFYGVDWPLDDFRRLAKKMKSVNKKGAENAYFRFLDEKFGDGNTPMEDIWHNVYKLAPIIQAGNDYKRMAPEVLKLLRKHFTAKIALSTNSERRDIEFYSSKASKTHNSVSPVVFFDEIVTLDDIVNPKPHPESYQKIIDSFGVNAIDVLAFEDSLSGVRAAKTRVFMLSPFMTKLQMLTERPFIPKSTTQ